MWRKRGPIQGGGGSCTPHPQPSMDVHAHIVDTHTHALEDGLPRQIELGLVVLDVDAVEPVLNGVQGL